MNSNEIPSILINRDFVIMNMLLKMLLDKQIITSEEFTELLEAGLELGQQTSLAESNKLMDVYLNKPL